MGHIHEGAAPGQNGPPIITLEKGADGSWSVPAGSKLTDEQYDRVQGGSAVRQHSQCRAQGWGDSVAAQTVGIAAGEVVSSAATVALCRHPPGLESLGPARDAFFPPGCRHGVTRLGGGRYTAAQVRIIVYRLR